MLARLDQDPSPRFMESVNKLRIKNESNSSPSDSVAKFRIKRVGPNRKINRIKKPNTYTLKLDSHLMPFISPDDAEMVYTVIIAAITRMSMVLLVGTPVILVHRPPPKMPPWTASRTCLRTE